MKGIDQRQTLINRVRRIVIKVGSRVLTQEDMTLDQAFFTRFCGKLAELNRSGTEVIVVSSGAIAAGRSLLGLNARPRTIAESQATAAVGQIELMQAYKRSFEAYGQQVAQVLLTHADLSDRGRFLNARHTLMVLLELGVIPLINENDTVAVEEIMVGDNDNLSAMVASLVGADLLTILSDIDGLYDSDPQRNPDARLIPVIEEVAVEVVEYGADTPSDVGIGGMVTKLEAARRAASYGISTIIANGKDSTALDCLFAGESIGTLILPSRERLGGRKHWIAYTLRPAGYITVDDGARQAIVDDGKSLLPSGIVAVRGEFGIGDPVELVDGQGIAFARGLVSYTTREIDRIKGRHSSEIEATLGYRYQDEVIHRDDLVVLQGLGSGRDK